MTAFLIGLIVVAASGSGAATYFVMDGPRRRHVAGLAAVVAREGRLADDRDSLIDDRAKLTADRAKLDTYATSLRQAKADHDRQAAALQQAKADFDNRVITTAALQAENRSLKAELKHAALHALKLEADQDTQDERLEAVRAAGDSFGRLHLKESQEWVTKGLTANNYALSKDRLRKSIDRVRIAGLDLPEADALPLFEALQRDYERAVRADLGRAEQAEIRERLREEQRRNKEAQDDVDRAAREQRLIEDALAKALAAARGQHADEVDRLRAKLAAAQAKSQRAQSNAQFTKVGHVYVISNVGAFGEGVYKIGLTRRTEPMDRVDELGVASVPFPFDVHMLISSQDAPALERSLHQAFHRHRVNRMNPRKEFFRVPLEDIVGAVERAHGAVDAVVHAEATQYRNGLLMTDADADLVERLYEEVGPAPAVED